MRGGRPSRQAGAPPPSALHLDTGMNRLGFASLSELRAALDRCGAVGADLLMSHFVASEEPENPLNARADRALRSGARGAAGHCPPRSPIRPACSCPGAPAYDLARPGYALYGGNPTPGAPNPMRPVVTLEVAIQQTRWIEAGETLRL